MGDKSIEMGSEFIYIANYLDLWKYLFDKLKDFDSNLKEDEKAIKKSIRITKSYLLAKIVK